jgi:hypothetical protein
MTRTLQSEFLADSEHDVYWTVRNTPFAQLMKHFADDRTSRLVISAQHRGAVGADYVALYHRFDAFAGNDGVHVRTQQQGRYAFAVPVKVADKISAIAVDFFARTIETASQPGAFQLPYEAHRNVSLAARERIYPDQVQKDFLQPGALD